MDTTPDRILSVAMELFARKGYHATSMREIAREARIVPSTIYSHFSGKEAILAEIIRWMKREILSTFRIDGSTGRSPLETYAENLHRSLTVNREFWRLIHTIRMNRELIAQVGGELDEIRSIALDGILNLLADTRQEAIDQHAAYLFWATVDGIVAASLLIDNYPLESVLSAFVDHHSKTTHRRNNDAID